jgi:phage terminase small subunit
MSKNNELSDKHKLFVAEYVKNNCNGTKAYMAVYPDSSEEASRSSASDLLSNPNIKEAIKEKINQVLNDKEELTLKLRNELECLSLSDIKDYINFDDENYRFKATNKSDTRAIESVKIKRRYENGKKEEDRDYVIEEVEFKMHNKKGAIDSLKQMIGIAEKLEIDTSDELKMFLVSLSKDDINRINESTD